MRLVPREEKFFNFFCAQARYIHQAAQILHRGAREGPVALAAAAQQLFELETRADGLIHDILKTLNKTFITPIDPEDIHRLGSHLDDVMDALEEAAHRMVAYRIDPIPGPAVEICGLVERTAETLLKAMECLRDGQTEALVEHCIEINRLEGDTDFVVRKAVADLFDQQKDPIELIKLKEVYEFLELATDYAEDVTDALQNVVIKNG